MAGARADGLVRSAAPAPLRLLPLTARFCCCSCLLVSYTASSAYCRSGICLNLYPFQVGIYHGTSHFFTIDPYGVARTSTARDWSPQAKRVDGFEKLQTLGDDDETEPALVVVENGDRGITMTAFGTLERGGWAALQKLDASALCASELVARDEAPCYCGAAADDCFEHADVIRELTKYVDDDDDDEDDVEAIAPAPRQAPPAGWGELLSA